MQLIEQRDSNYHEKVQARKAKKLIKSPAVFRFDDWKARFAHSRTTTNKVKGTTRLSKAEICKRTNNVDK